MNQCWVAMGEVVGPYSITMNTVAVVKWFLDKGFDVWGSTPTTPEEAKP